MPSVWPGWRVVFATYATTPLAFAIARAISGTSRHAATVV